MTDPSQAISELARVEGGRILAVLTRATGDVELAEDAVQDAIVAALEVWPRAGVPRDPAGWLYVAARRKALDVLRRESRRGDKELASRIERDPPEPSVLRDDQLRLIFTCTHPALDMDARVALTLRTVCGLSVAEVARALLTSETAMAKRLVRARRKITVAGIPYRIPAADELPQRLAGVTAVLHLVYTAGHAATGEALLRHDLADEAVRLARLLADLLPDDPAPDALLALLLLTDARRPARTDAHGALVPLAEQDRSTWDSELIEEGMTRLARSLARTDGQADPYQLQGAIAACHATAPSYAATDWPEVVRLYRLLASVHPNPVVDINAAVAVAETEGPARAQEILATVPPSHRSYLWHAAVAEMHLRTGDGPAAAAALTLAASVAPSEPERRHLERRARTPPVPPIPIDLTVDVRTSASPAEVWALIWDLDRYGEWNPECRAARWLDDGPVAAAGRRFEGRNEWGGRTWTVTCHIIASIAPRWARWTVSSPARPSSTWSYELVEQDGGAMVRQRFTHGPGVSGITGVIRDDPAQAHRVIAARAQMLESNMREGLHRMLALAERTV